MVRENYLAQSFRFYLNSSAVGRVPLIAPPSSIQNTFLSNKDVVFKYYYCHASVESRVLCS